MFEFGFKGLAALLLAGLLAVSCHSAASMSAFEAASGKPNTVDTPVFTPSGGWTASGHPVSLSCSTTGAVIKYTLDGSDPAYGSIYTAPLYISQNTVVNAKAVKSGFPESSVTSQTYSVGVSPIQLVYTCTGASPVQVGTSTTVYNNCTVALAAPGGSTSGAATVYYTLDGTAPTASSSSWDTSQSAPVVATLSSSNKIVRVRAYGVHASLDDSVPVDLTITLVLAAATGTVTGSPLVVTLSSPSSTVPTGSSLTFTASVTAGGLGVTNGLTYGWYLNGTDQSVNTPAYSTSSSLAVGRYTLSCLVTDGQGNVYTASTNFTVEQTP